MSASLIHQSLDTLKRICEEVLWPVVQLGVRLMVAYQFFISGWLKFGYVLNGQLDTLYYLFEDYDVPLLPVPVAAWMGMSGELILSTLLAFGLFGRFAGLGLIFMCAVIYHTDGNMLAPYWALLCAVVVAKGAGTFSIDKFINKVKR